MKKIYNIILLLVAIFITGCALERSNPLDPENNNLNTPQLVRNIVLTTSEAEATEKFVEISWDALVSGEADGYFIYRSRSVDGTFDLIADIRNREHTSYIDNYRIVAGAYFYKMSAYNYLNPSNPNDDDRLEGPLNTPKDPGIYVPE